MQFTTEYRLQTTEEGQRSECRVPTGRKADRRTDNGETDRIMPNEPENFNRG